jgi:hypothetical protein
VSAVDLSQAEAHFLLDCVSYFRDSPAFRQRYMEMVYGLACKLAPVSIQDDGEAVTREPSGDSPDSPPAGEPGLQGADPEPVTIAFAGDDPRDDPANILPLTREEYIKGLQQFYGPGSKKFS